MSQHNRNTTQRFRTSTERSPFRTVAGSYEAPVEGIVDYGAFSRGFESTFTLPEKEEVKLPGRFEDIDLSGGLSKTTNFGFNEVATKSYNESLNREIQNLQDEYDLAYVRNGEGSREVQNVMAKYKHLVKVVSSSELAIKQMVDNEGAFDMQQAMINPTTKGIGIGENNTSPFVNLVNTKRQTKDSNHSLFIDYENQTGGVSANGYMYDTSSINENNIGSLTPVRSGVDSKANEFAKEFKIVLDPVTSTTGNTGQSTLTKTTTSFTQESVNALNEGARIFAEQKYDANKQPEDFQATLLDAVFGIHRRRGSATPEQIKNKEFVSFIDSFNEDGGYSGADGKKYTFDDFKKHIEAEAISPGSGNIPSNVVNSFTREAVENRFKINVGSKLYTANEYNEAVRREDLVSTKRRTPDDIELPGAPSKSSIVEDRLFNISSNLNSTTFKFTNENQGGFVKPGEETDIDPGTLLQGFFSDTTGTKATIVSAKVKNIGKKDTTVKGKKVEGKDRHVIEITYEANGKVMPAEIFDLDETGRRKLTERAYKGQFAGEKDIATDLATGEENYQIKRQAVQEAFGAAGKDVTMRRRLNIINNYKSDSKVFNTLKEEDKKLLMNIRNTSDLAKKYKDFLEDGQDFDNN